jgi:nitroimidazol reductase NimA-like FMN-containing flavoprotein (pyridoxamine 5'-phosphate oxidase superfamily)
MTHEGIDVLDRNDCYALLREGTLGRVGVTLTDEPVILPVYYAMLEDDIVFRTSSGTKLNAALLRTRVAFEVDDPKAAWSVLVTGHAQEIRTPSERAVARERLGNGWPTGERECLVRIHVEKVTGRRLRMINLTRSDVR